METGSEIMQDDNKIISNDESWTDINLNEEHGETNAGTREDSRNIHNMAHSVVDTEGNTVGECGAGDTRTGPPLVRQEISVVRVPVEGICPQQVY